MSSAVLITSALPSSPTYSETLSPKYVLIDVRHATYGLHSFSYINIKDAAN